MLLVRAVGLLSQSGRRGMGTSQKFLVVSLARADFRKLKVEPLACAFLDKRDYRLAAAASASCCLRSHIAPKKHRIV